MPPDQPRRFADRYRLEAILGRGGMGEVWRGYDERLNRECAVKVLRIMEDAPSAERFFREARMLASLRHPGVVTVYDYGVEDDRPYLVMELLPGPSLADLVRENGPLTVEQVRKYGSQAAYALQAVHDAGVVHRDVKPGNLVIDQGGNVRLVDFGIALGGTAGVGAATLTEHGAIIGSAAYLSPEQAVGRRADARSDLYGLGCLLMSLLTGKPPFEDDSPVNILGQHLNDPAPLVSSRRPEVPGDIDQIVDDLLAKNPAARPANAAEAGRRIAGGAAARPGPPPPPMPPRAAETTALLPPPGAAAPALATTPAGSPGHTGNSAGGRIALVAALLVLSLAGGAVAWALTRGGGDEDAEQAGPVPSATSTRKTPKATPSASGPTAPTPTAPSVIDVPIPTFTNIVTMPPIKQTPKPQPTTEPEPEPEPPVPTAELDALDKAVDDATVDESIAPDAKTDLKARAGAIRASAEGGQQDEAKTKLDEFITKVGELEGSGALDPETAAKLKKAAEDVKNAMA